MANPLLDRAAHTRPAGTVQGALERLFTFMFKGFVYNQIWEDPAVDLAALDLKPHHRVITIASGGCNVLNYLSADPAKIIGVDLNTNHLALTRLKIAALRELPSYDGFFRFFGEANDKANHATFDEILSPRLDPETRQYWRRWSPFGGRRINMFANNLYHYSLMGRFIGILHVIARLNGKRLEEILEAKTCTEQRAAFDRIIAPMLENKAIQLASKSPISLYALGIPPAQYSELVAGSADNPIAILRARIEKLACGFPVSENYFAWQAFAREYDLENREAVPPYLRREVYDVIRTRTDRIEIHHASLIDFLEMQPAQSLHRFVLLDAQDWMAPETLNRLWTQIDRTATSSDARVIFRTAGADSLLPRKLSPSLLAPWQYREEESVRLHKQDRSSIYGGFHIYARRPLS
jgi:S-adenosylmethionine-diacylglycerol 3-amino-3-carboxypropyl transferase